jgi:prepilin-type N-terminal cleavage/methylation domain-containing protein
MGRSRTRSGFTLVEVTVAAAIMAIVLFAIVTMTMRDSRASKAALSIGAAEMRAQQMLTTLQRELYDARGANPAAVLTQALGSTETNAINVDSTAGFPDRGMLLVDRGTGSVERVAYAGLSATQFTGLTRGAQCTSAVGHTQGALCLWAGLAEPIPIQTNPASSLYDGRARESVGNVYFRGDGAGFSYRVPTDPSGGTNYLVGDDVTWGAVVGGQPLLSGWSALYFDARNTFSEATSAYDLNKDGDLADLYDIGQIRRRTWDTASTTGSARELGLGPTFVIQERCNFGGDLDGDGFDDPLFLWDPLTRRLHVRLFILGTTAGNLPIVRAVESTIFLRNEPEN